MLLDCGLAPGGMHVGKRLCLARCEYPRMDYWESSEPCRCNGCGQIIPAYGRFAISMDVFEVTALFA